MMLVQNQILTILPFNETKFYKIYYFENNIYFKCNHILQTHFYLFCGSCGYLVKAIIVVYHFLGFLLTLRYLSLIFALITYRNITNARHNSFYFDIGIVIFFFTMKKCLLQDLRLSLVCSYKKLHVLWQKAFFKCLFPTNRIINKW